MSKKSMFLKSSVEGVDMLVNKTHIVSAHAKSTAYVLLRMVNGDELKFPMSAQTFRELEELELPQGLVKTP